MKYLNYKTKQLLLIISIFSLSIQISANANSKPPAIEPEFAVAEKKVTDCYRQKHSSAFAKQDRRVEKMTATKQFENPCLKLAFEEVSGLASAPNVQMNIVNVVKQSEERFAFHQFYSSVLKFNPMFCEIPEMDELVQNYFKNNEMKSPEGNGPEDIPLAMLEGCTSSRSFVEKVKKARAENKNQDRSLCRYEQAQRIFDDCQ